MALATVGEDGLPSLRMMLLEDFDSRGFVIQTNLESPKARALAATPAAALAFYWPLLVRQVRVTGRVEPLPRDEMAGYFAQAPSGVQAMLRACHQSQVIADRSELERMFAESVKSSDTGLPAHWGGYRLVVATIEFWQGRENWLQDRLRYTRTDRLAHRTPRAVVTAPSHPSPLGERRPESVRLRRQPREVGPSRGERRGTPTQGRGRASALPWRLR